MTDAHEECDLSFPAFQNVVTTCDNVRKVVLRYLKYIYY